jgi:putative aminopeptidase FrvX
MMAPSSIDGINHPMHSTHMRKESLKFLEELVNTPSPTSYETRGQRVWLNYVSQFADETSHDEYGNCVATLNKGGGPRIMLAGHADEIALSVNYIDNDGYIWVKRMGGVDAIVSKAQRVTIHTHKGPVIGVIGNPPPHMQRVEGETKAPKITDLFIDIGCNSRKSAEKRVRIGDPITVNQNFEILHKDIAVARAFDNRIGTWAVAEALRLLTSSKKLNAEICAVSNTMEEVGLFGARQIAYSLKPDTALVVDVTHATDYPGINKQTHGDIRMGKGPTITHGICNHPEVVKRIEQVADKAKISLQHETVSATSGTDTDAVFWTRGGIPSALISLPNRYMHSPVEVINLKDLEQIPKLMAGFSESLKKNETFKVKI